MKFGVPVVESSDLCCFKAGEEWDVWFQKDRASNSDMHVNSYTFVFYTVMSPRKICKCVSINSACLRLGVSARADTISLADATQAPECARIASRRIGLRQM